MCNKAKCIAREQRLEEIERKFKAMSTCLRTYAATLERASVIRRVILDLVDKINRGRSQ